MITHVSLRLGSTNVQILKVTSVYSLLAKTHSLHVHYGCALCTMTSRISSKAEHCCTLEKRLLCLRCASHRNDSTSPAVGIGQCKRHSVEQSAQPRAPACQRALGCADCSTECRLQKSRLSTPLPERQHTSHHWQDVAAALLVDTEDSASAAHKHSMFTVQWCKSNGNCNATSGIQSGVQCGYAWHQYLQARGKAK